MDKKSYINKVRYEQYTNAASSLSPIVYGSLVGNAVTATNASYVPFTGLTGNPTIWNQNTTGTANLAIALTTTLPISGGGTGQVTVKPALNALLPTQVAMNGKYLRTEGVNAFWDNIYTTATNSNDLVGPTLAASVVNSSLTSIGTLTAVNTSGVITGTNTTASTSSATGALIVAGGVGIAKDSFINGLLVGIGGVGAGLVTSNAAFGKDALTGNTGTETVGIGENAGSGNSGNASVFIGKNSGYGNSGVLPLGIGSSSLYENTGSSCVGIGIHALFSNDGDHCVAIGYATLAHNGIGNQGASNTAIGYFAGNINSTGAQSTFIGRDAGVLNTTGSDQVFIGSNAGDSCTTGTQNTVLGSQADLAANNDNNSIVIGYNVVGLGSNTTVIGNSSTKETKLLGKLSITGKVINVSTQYTPASATSSGDKGDITHDTNYIYVCTATNTWKRTAISTW